MESVIEPVEHGTFCIVSPIRDGGALALSMSGVESRLAGQNISFSRPKIGRHITFAPPFVANRTEMGWLAMGLEFARTFHSDSGMTRIAHGNRIDFFRGTTDSLIIRLSVSNDVRDLIERIRSLIPKKTRWVYPIESYLANFHATIGEGEGLYSAVAASGESKRPEHMFRLFDGININPPVQLDPPTLFEKIDGGWVLWRM